MTESGSTSGPVRVYTIPAEAHKQYAHNVHEAETGLEIGSVPSTAASVATRIIDAIQKHTAFDVLFSVRPRGIVHFEDLPRADARLYALHLRMGQRLFGMPKNIDLMMELVGQVTKKEDDREVKEEGETIATALKQVKEEVHNALSAYARMAGLTQG